MNCQKHIKIPLSLFSMNKQLICVVTLFFTINTLTVPENLPTSRRLEESATGPEKVQLEVDPRVEEDAKKILNRLGSHFREIIDRAEKTRDRDIAASNDFRQHHSNEEILEIYRSRVPTQAQRNTHVQAEISAQEHVDSVFNDCKEKMESGELTAIDCDELIEKAWKEFEKVDTEDQAQIADTGSVDN